MRYQGKDRCFHGDRGGQQGVPDLTRRSSIAPSRLTASAMSASATPTTVMLLLL
jgi:hypothetical protein